MLQDAFSVRHNVWLPENKLRRIDLGVVYRTRLSPVGLWRNNSVLRLWARCGAQYGSYTGMYLAHGLCIPLDACVGTRPLPHAWPYASFQLRQARHILDAIQPSARNPVASMCAWLGCRLGVALATLGQLFAGQWQLAQPTDRLPENGRVLGYALGASIVHLVRAPSWLCKIALPAVGFLLGVVLGLLVGCVYCDLAHPDRVALPDPPTILGGEHVS